MKRISAIIISAVMALSVCACGGGAKTVETTTAAVETTTAEESTTAEEATATEAAAMPKSTSWFEATEVDEFGDAVVNSENIYIKNITTGDFSNTATASSDLGVEIVLTPRKTKVFMFTLSEYENKPATYTNSSNISLKVKIGNDITDYKLKGTAPNGPLILGYDNDDSEKIFNALYYGQDVRCIIYIDNSQYNFTIPSEGFEEICKKEQEKIEAINEKNRVKDIASVVNTILTEPDGSTKLGEAYQYLSDNREDYQLMADEDIKAEIDGDFYYVSMSDSKNNGIILTYRYVMEYNGDKKTQKLYFKQGVKTVTPEKQSTSTKFVYNDGIIEGSKPCQLRKMSDGYYVAYISDGSEYTIPNWVIMKGHQDSTGFSCDYPLPE